MKHERTLEKLFKELRKSYGRISEVRNTVTMWHDRFHYWVVPICCSDCVLIVRVMPKLLGLFSVYDSCFNDESLPLLSTGHSELLHLVHCVHYEVGR
jgi:hypothetical protein